MDERLTVEGNDLDDIFYDEIAGVAEVATTTGGSIVGILGTRTPPISMVFDWEHIDAAKLGGNQSGRPGRRARM